jgi:hypothetical protein
VVLLVLNHQLVVLVAQVVVVLLTAQQQVMVVLVLPIQVAVVQAEIEEVVHQDNIQVVMVAQELSSSPM